MYLCSIEVTGWRSVPAFYAPRTKTRCFFLIYKTRLTHPCMLTSPTESLLPLSDLVERRTIGEAEDGEAAVGSKVQNLGGMRWKMRTRGKTLEEV